MFGQKYLLLKSLLASLLLLIFACQSETTIVKTANGEEEISTDELLKIMGETYLYGYPLVLMDLTKKVSTNIEQPHPVRSSAPVNQLGHYRAFPDHTMRAVVKPNVDTYYSSAWLDLKNEPLVMSMPATERYYLLQLMDAYSNVFSSLGPRTTGKGAHNFLIAGPDWEGEIPEGMELIQAPTQLVWLLGRIQVNNPTDGATTVKAIQDKMKLVPLSAYGATNYTPPTGKVNETYVNTIPVQAIQDLDVNTYFNKMAEMMVENPPKAADSVMLKKMAKIGLVAGEPFEMSTDNAILKLKLSRLPAFIHQRMNTLRTNPDTSETTNGWSVPYDGIGTYGTDYKRRAYIDFVGLGANIPEDAVYPSCLFDVNGNRLIGQKRYHIHFDKDQLPPVNAFWSLTAYNEQDFLVKNELNRFALGDRDNLIYNADGSLDLYIQSERPTEVPLENWLPVPASGVFTLTFRLYWPKQEVLDGQWNIPFVVPVE
ncbi:MAG: DUF1254 domain-containing protein [Bacteroidota bacterium]